MADMQEPEAPVSVLLPTDAPVAQLANIPAATNYAEETEVFNYCKGELAEIIGRTKDRRRNLEDEWLAQQRLITLTHDGGQKYKGRSNVYLPNFANAHNTLVTTVVKGLFPSDDYLDVESQSFEGTEAAEQVKAALKYELDCNAKLRQHIKPGISQLVLHGNCVYKYGYRTGAEFIGRKGKNKLPAFKKRPARGLFVSARSIFNVVVYPETAEDEKDIIVTAEFIDIDRNYAIALGQSRRWLNMEMALKGASNTDTLHQYARDQALVDMAKIAGMTESVDGSNDMRPIAQTVVCIEAYANLRLPASAYVEGEDKSLPIPARIVFINSVPVEVTRNMNYDQKTPYLWARQGLVPGSFYGSWAGRRARYLQYLINDLANQTNDTGIMGLNPFMVVDTNLLTGPLQPFAPGRVFHTRDVKNAIAFQHPPMEPIQYGQQMVNMYAGALVDGVGAPPVLQGMGKSGETATGQSILQRNALSPLQDVVEDIEAQVMVPLMERAWRLVVQFTDRGIMITDPMGQPQQISVDDLDEFDYNFKFLSSSQAANKQVQGQQAIQLLQTVGGMVPLLQANGMMVNPTPVLRKLYGDVFGWRQFDQFIFKLPPMQPMGMPGMPGQGQPGQETPVHGAEQNAPQGQNADQEPVASQELSEVRAPVDEINAMEQKRGLG